MAAKINDVKEQLNISLRDSNKPWTKVFDLAEAKTGVDRLYIFVGGVGILSVWLVFGFAAQLICNFIGFVYPAYTSVKAIESHNKDDDTKWLTYWVVFALFSVVEYFSDMLVGWFPVYWLAKCVFLVWLMMPSDYNGSVMLYRRLVRPYFLKNVKKIDETVSSLKESATKYVGLAAENLKKE